ncbi:Oxidoreductase/transition metal ion-binding protein [Rhynchospora pubera]|uniref:Oxidoreductase/transition metal ion-binding protein n=1 Tax=Rhynchospora pubera TaxID=906938 RepID=A0AAV8CX16_9POAL|nr:Oxidoreductase/transition metal ion-binding protein [Rhynchospora pubera]
MASCSYYHSNNYNYSTFNYLTDLPLHLCFFLLTLFLFLGFSFYMSFESASESLADQTKLLLILSPLLLVLAVHCLSNVDTRHLSFSFLVPEQESIHRAGGSPWGVAILLVVLIFMVYYQSSFHEMWFPFGR